MIGGRTILTSSEKMARSMMFLAFRPAAISLMFTAFTTFCAGRGAREVHFRWGLPRGCS